MPEDIRDSLLELKESIGNVHTDEEIEEMERTLGKAIEHMTGIGKREFSYDESFDLPDNVVNVTLNDEELELITETVENNFLETLEAEREDFSHMAVLRIVPPNRALLKVRE